MGVEEVHSGMDPMMEAMRSTFYFGRRISGGLLFSSWVVDSTGSLIGAIVAVFCLAVMYEGLKSLREFLVYLDYKHWNKHSRTPNNIQGEEDDEDDETDRRGLITRKSARARPRGFKYFSISISMHVVQSALHVVQVGYAYILMLIVMTFNAWLFLAVVFGAGVGYLMFAKSRHLMGNFREQNEHCH